MQTRDYFADPKSASYPISEIDIYAVERRPIDSLSDSEPTTSSSSSGSSPSIQRLHPGEAKHTAGVGRTHRRRQRPHTPPLQAYGRDHPVKGLDDEKWDPAYSETSGAQEHLTLPQKRASPPSDDHPEGGTPHLSPPASSRSTKFSALPKINTMDVSPPPPPPLPLPFSSKGLGFGCGDEEPRSYWSPDTPNPPSASPLTPDSVMATPFPEVKRGASTESRDVRGREGEQSDEPTLENHLKFVVSVSPKLEKRNPMAESSNSGEGARELEEDYETDSTLSLTATPVFFSPSPSASGSPTPGTPKHPQQKHSSGLEALAARNRTVRARYTHGHDLVRMPGKVKGFGDVPHYHHRMHKATTGKALLKVGRWKGLGIGSKQGSRNGSRKGSGKGTPSRSGGETPRSGIASPRMRPKASLSEGEEEHVLDLGVGLGLEHHLGEMRGNEEDEEDLGAAFVNLNLSETGRDVRVLVRSKQMRAKAGGMDLKEYDKIIDELMEEQPLLFEDVDDLYHRKLIMHPKDDPKYMIKRLQISASELLVVLELNQSELRSLEWNPAPRVICAIDRPRSFLLSDRDVALDERLGRPDDDVFLFFEPLDELVDDSKEGLPKTVDGWLEMFEGLLEGLTFLHEHHVAGFRCNLLRSFMRYKERAPPDSTSSRPVGEASKPRYRFVDFAEARRVPLPSRSVSREHDPNAKVMAAAMHPAVEKDVKDLGVLFQMLLDEHVEELQARMAWVVREMTRGGVSADEARVFVGSVRRDMEKERWERDGGETLRRRGHGLRSERSKKKSGAGRASGTPKILVSSVPTATLSRSTSEGGSRFDLEKEQEAVRPSYYYESDGDSEDPNDLCDDDFDEGLEWERRRPHVVMLEDDFTASSLDTSSSTTGPETRSPEQLQHSRAYTRSKGTESGGAGNGDEHGHRKRWVWGLPGEEEKGKHKREKEGGMVAKFAVPALGNARLTYAEIVPARGIDVAPSKGKN